MTGYIGNWEYRREDDKKPEPVKKDLLKWDRAMFDAAQAGDADGLQKAFAKGANINETDGTGRMAIHYAQERGDKAMMKQMIENGADIAKAAEIIQAHAREASEPDDKATHIDIRTSGGGPIIIL